MYSPCSCDFLLKLSYIGNVLDSISPCSRDFLLKLSHIDNVLDSGTVNLFFWFSYSMYPLVQKI